MHRNLWSWEKTFSGVHLLTLSMLVGLIGVAIFPIHAATPVGAAMAMPAGMVMPPGETMAGAMPASKPDKDKHKASHHHQLRKGDLVPPAQGPHPLPNIGLPPEAGPVSPQPQRPLAAAVTAPLATTTTAPVCQTPAVAQTINLKVLVIAADGSEADLPAITQTLTFLGTPYDVYVATQHSGSQPGVSSGLTPNLLSSGTTGFYQGVILTTGSLAYYNGSGYVSGLSTQEWQNLWTYESTFCIREVSWYTYPTADYGFQSPSAGVYPSSTPLNGTFTTAGQSLFGGYVNTARPVGILNAYTYQAQPLADGLTTSLLNDPQGNALAVVRTAATGRQTLALTFDSNPSLVHTLQLAYGLVNWVTNGRFLGERHVYLGGQIDDMYIEDDIWTPSTACGTNVEQTGATYRITGPDFKAFDSWQANVRGQATTAGLRLSIAFNGLGSGGDYTAPAPDTLVPEINLDEYDFNWISHTYDHIFLDNVDYATAQSEIVQNNDVAASVGFEKYSKATMVTPNVSGLTNPNFLQAAYDSGIRYLVTDTSLPNYNNPSPNAGIYNSYQPSILMIPRHPVNLYYNVSQPSEWLAEDNCLYPSGAYGHVASYQQLLDRESSMLLQYLLKGDIDPLMFHQPNIRAYDGTHSLLSDLLDATRAKYNALFKLRIQSPTMDGLGQLVANRMQYNNAGVAASVTRDSSGRWTSLTVTTHGAVTAPVTGLNIAGAESYGGQMIAHVQLKAGGSATYALS